MTRLERVRARAEHTRSVRALEAMLDGATPAEAEVVRAQIAERRAKNARNRDRQKARLRAEAERGQDAWLAR